MLKNVFMAALAGGIALNLLATAAAAQFPEVKTNELLHSYQPGNNQILPTPQKISYNSQEFKVSALDSYQVKIAAGNPDTERLKRAAERLLVQESNLPVATGTENARIQIEVTDDPALPENVEGYTVKIDANQVVVRSRSARGAFYGMQLLKELRTASGFRGAEVTDWPVMTSRSILMMVDKDSADFHAGQIRDILAPMRFNQLIIEAEYVKWDATKDIHQDWGMEKDDLRKLIAFAKDNFMEVEPLLQTLGHCEWLFKDGKNLDMAEYPYTPYAYNVSHPGVYPLMTAIMEEILDVFQPTRLHIGHDEVAWGTPFPWRPENIEKGGQKIFLDDVMFYYDFCKKNNLTMMMWQDMFHIYPDNDLANGVSYFDLHKVINEKLPHDIEICYWDYSPNIPKNNIRLLKEMGFPLIGCTWYDEDNISRFTSFMAEENLNAMMVTTWAGYTNSYVMYERDFAQAACYFKNGSWFWNPGEENNQYSAGKRLYDILRPAPLLHSGSGRMVDIAAVANLPMKDDAPLNMGILGKHSGKGGVADFILPKKADTAYAVAMKSSLNPDLPADAVTVPLSGKAEKIYVLHAMQRKEAGDVPRNAVIANYTITYKNGDKLTFPTVYGKDIALPQDDYTLQMPPGSAISWPDGFRERKMWIMTIDNPRPEAELAGISVQNHEEYPFYWFGLSLQD